MRRVLFAVFLLLAAPGARADDEPVVFDEDTDVGDESSDRFVGPPRPREQPPAALPNTTTPPTQPVRGTADEQEPPPAWSPDYGGDSSAATPEAAAAAQQNRQKASSRRSAASAAASRMAQSLKALAAGADVGALGAAGKLPGSAAGALGSSRPGVGPGGAPKPGGAPGQTAPGDSAQDVSSWLGSYQSLAASRGLVPYKGEDGRIAFRRKDGRPASEAEVAELRAAAAREPGALAKYPDFFNVIPRAQYDQLRQDFGRSPDRPAYKDMALTSDQRKDFVWDRSCDKVSGDCNPHAVESSYKKDEFVKPETAKNAWDSILALMDQVREENAAPDGLSKLGSRLTPFARKPPAPGEEPGSAAQEAGAAPTAAERTASAGSSAFMKASAPARAYATVKAYLSGKGGNTGKLPVTGLLIGLGGVLALAAAWAKTRS